MRVLVHVCCAPCYGAVHAALEGEGNQVSGLFYNPNIHPYQEYRKRLHEVQRFAYLKGAEIAVLDEYDVGAWLRGAMAETEKGKKRCVHCYRSRLDRAASHASEGGFDAFTTTLLSSTHQDHECIRRIGEESGRAHGVEFLYRDFRTGKKDSYRISKELDLYRQGYCGCIFSEQERYKGD